MQAHAQPVSDLALTVAGLRLDFRCEAGLALEPPAWEHPPFLLDAPWDVRVTACVTAAPPSPAGDLTLRFDTGDGWRALAAGARWRFELADREAGASLWVLETRAPFGRWTLHCGPALTRPGPPGKIARHLVQYPLDQIMLSHALLGHGGLLVHAAGAVATAGAVAFAGVSGAGKSTLSRLLGAAPGWRVLSDDRVVLRTGGSTTTLHGTPWAGDARIAVAAGAPLAAFCFLGHASRCALRRLTDTEALDRLLPVTTVPWYAAELVDPALTACAALVRAAPCYELDFSLDREPLVEVLAELPRAA